MYFFHNKCGNDQLAVSLDKLIVAKFQFSIGINSLRLGSGDVNFKNDKNLINNPEIYCFFCGKDIEISEIIGRCFNCGERFNLKLLFKIDGSGGAYCQECCQKLDPDRDRTSLEYIFSRLSLGRK